MSQQKLHVRKGDTVYILTGKDAGKKGKVLQVLPSKRKVLVEGVNVVKKHSRPTRSIPQGGIIEKEAFIDSSNVMLVCGKCNKPTRVAKKIADDRYYRACKKCGEIIDK
ncbi:50S ribosomal protein L24 [Syntrophaceticus schinkii]|jgi:large subunit ribosomal protein L24|uniref:Large ribosomal subunit protein uL24 n=1 Tax=Syntrophaceticus schinkii TaxID=499207 RepID=A0A0B7MJD3_9FIRM|nr:50S ribosomal protein L24 [Syntrophaceticus schinkii]MDD2360389.1 50S ribosomal protein L24 [Syntrophaceticus schinkii]MDD4261522.1 50S ribosomal protein L24 [Syntrophaceticus schinkii]MDD4675111.1 50S ribosomal protein L24 [Syntrophaceticus schinkii]CEO90160.1 ribosomal protein L24 (BL23) [Syntrophaceticus schinkii]